MNSALYCIALTGSGFEIFGVILAANRYFPVSAHEVPYHLLRAVFLWRQPPLTGIVMPSSTENPSLSIRGFGLIFVGFLLQALATVGFLGMNFAG